MSGAPHTYTDVLNYGSFKFSGYGWAILYNELRHNTETDVL